MVNMVGIPHVTLPTLLNFPTFHAFKDGGLRMIWNFHSSNMEKSNVDEEEQAMGFRIGTTTMQGICKGTHKQILRQVMDFNCLTWILNLIST
jgi:hypothetical protein